MSIFAARTPSNSPSDGTLGVHSHYRHVQALRAQSADELREQELERLRPAALRFSVLMDLGPDEWEKVYQLHLQGFDLNTMFDAIARTHFKKAMRS